MRNICMKIAYDGTLFNGFQAQPKGRTVQGELKRAISALAKQEVDVHASGRTDAGVHARGQVVHFLSNITIPVERIPIALNTRLPKDIVVLEANEMDESFHSRHLAKQKTYRYTIDNGKYPDIFGRHYRLHVPQTLNREHMRQAVNCLVGTHDFTSFTSVKSVKPHHVRTIYKAELIEEGNFMHIELTGNGFTYNMVRIITGTLIKIGLGQKMPEDMPSILKGCNRSLAGPTALPIGLCLMNVVYD